jgi:transposase
MRLRKTLVDERTKAVAAHPRHAVQLRSLHGPQAVALSPAARERVEAALAMVDHLEAELGPTERALRLVCRPAVRLPSARPRAFGIGTLTATTVLAELGDATLLSSSRKAVRFCGLDA